MFYRSEGLLYCVGTLPDCCVVFRGQPVYTPLVTSVSTEVTSFCVSVLQDYSLVFRGQSVCTSSVLLVSVFQGLFLYLKCLVSEDNQYLTVCGEQVPCVLVRQSIKIRTCTYDLRSKGSSSSRLVTTKIFCVKGLFVSCTVSELTIVLFSVVDSVNTFHLTSI